VRIWGGQGADLQNLPAFLFMNLKQIIVQDALTCIDFVNPVTGLTYHFRQTLEQVQARCPGAYLTDFESWNAAKEKALCSATTEIDEEKFMEMLEVLPPQRWQRGPQCESFELSEHTSGRVTSIYVRIKDRYFTFQGIYGQPLAEHLAKVSFEMGLAL
jgi:hypothetical protein